MTGQKVKLRKEFQHELEPSKWDNVCAHYLQLYSMCKEFHTLPGDGGWEAQDWLVCHFFNVIAMAVRELEAAHINRQKNKEQPWRTAQQRNKGA